MFKRLTNDGCTDRFESVDSIIESPIPFNLQSICNREKIAKNAGFIRVRQEENRLFEEKKKEEENVRAKRRRNALSGNGTERESRVR